VTFAADEGNVAVLVVEAVDRPGLLWAITRTLFEQGVIILHSEVATIEGTARDRFHVAEPPGLPLSIERRREIAQAVALSVQRAGPA
jgi:UTP:GlnB (protein PII) uridylyltransferase